MTEDEREKLIEDMAKASWAPLAAQPWDKALKIVKQQRLIEARAALAIAERRIREDCAEIARDYPATMHGGLSTDPAICARQAGNEITAAILASIPEPKESQ